MKVGVRKVNLKNRVKARTTGKVKRAVKKSVNPFYGKKGVGMITDPKKAVYNKVYNKTTVSVDTLAGLNQTSNNTWELEDEINNTDEIRETDLNKLFKNAPEVLDTSFNPTPTIDKKDLKAVLKSKYSDEEIQALASKYFKISMILLIISIIIYFFIPPIGCIGVIAGIVFLVKSKKIKKVLEECHKN